MFLEALRDLWGPGLVFLGLCIWLIRRVVRAARTESQLEEERLRQWVQEHAPEQLETERPSAPRLAAVPAEPRAAAILDGTDVRGAAPEHVGAVAAELAQGAAAPENGRGPEVPWIRSAGTHVAWCERRRPAPPATAAREVICVAEVQDGKLVGRWQFG